MWQLDVVYDGELYRNVSMFPRGNFYIPHEDGLVTFILRAYVTEYHYRWRV